MAVIEGDWETKERPIRFFVALAASSIGLGAILTRDQPAVDLPLMLPTIGVFWCWAVMKEFPIWPLYVLGTIVPVVLNIIESDAEVSMFLVFFIAALAAVVEPNRVAVAVGIVGVGLTILILGVSSALSDFAWPNWLVAMAFAWGAGDVVHRFGLTIEELQATRALIADQAAVNERRRIARDVHDLVGHSLSVVMLHLTGARHLVKKDPDEAILALEQAEMAGRESLAEIRRTVGLLREDEDATSAALPSPDLGDIEAIVNEFAAAGLDITYSKQGDLDSVDSAAAVAGYRIVQEAITNVTRHTTGASVNVSIIVSDSSYELSVLNHGGSVLPGRAGSGFGLVSMRERAKSVGASLLAGPTPSGWSVEASIPITDGQAAGLAHTSSDYET